MGRATGVPHDAPQYVAISQDGANHEQCISTNYGLQLVHMKKEF